MHILIWIFVALLGTGACQVTPPADVPAPAATPTPVVSPIPVQVEPDPATREVRSSSRRRIHPTLPSSSS